MKLITTGNMLLKLDTDLYNQLNQSSIYSHRQVNVIIGLNHPLRILRNSVNELLRFQLSKNETNIVKL